MPDKEKMLADYKDFCERKLELFNILIKVSIGQIKKEELGLPVNLLEKTYNAMEEYTKCLGLSLNLLGVETKNID